MNNIDTVAHMNMHYTQYWAHWALFIDAQLCHIAPVAQVRLARVIPSMHVRLCVALWLISLHPSPVFYFVPPFFFQPFQMFFSEFNERSRSKPLCDFRLGTVATSDHETHLTSSFGEYNDPVNRKFLLEQYEERIKILSQTDGVSKFCTDEGLKSVVEIGQYFMTIVNGKQFYAKSCREYAHPRRDGSSQPRRMDLGKHKNWTRAGSYDFLLVSWTRSWN